MLRIGLTGGIAAGKSLVASRLAELGGVLVDADVLARAAVEPGSAGLAAVAAEFGEEVLLPDGSLDRPALAAAIFGDPSRRMTLNSIIHPLVRERARELTAAAPPAAVVVQDIPLLVETGQQHQFHLVVVVDAPDSVRIERLTSLRGMSDDDARARIGAQATRAERKAAADVVLVNDSTPQDLLAAVDRLWDERLVPFNHNLVRGVRAARSGGPQLVPSRDDWPEQAGRIMGRVRLVDPLVLAVDHIGSTAVPGLAAKDVLDLQVTVATLEDADAIAGKLVAAGFPPLEGITRDEPKQDVPDPSRWGKRLHANADPGRAVNLHVRVEGSPGWRYALSFRDWLRSDLGAAAQYQAEKERCAAQHTRDATTEGYAECKENWFTTVADPLLKRWIADTGWTPQPSSAVG
ncbi:dephospho-CoA kinase [Arthrobacter sp. Bz4]|uniref:dephospho-CoA kinase n=1 Tax=Arthrobacter sp. Bz4 TaxID=2171979 RepID=UPI000D518C73|nr:dephospho-CoA kinase [Arthrobacter sp. Bz4]PVE17008.1 dephospho-CoA kinase [Arthrobacter sp. Bz4]